ncbi:MAG: carboxypeptidase regulatory-like domain-containing protein [Acidobacteria bacterium]|nr:carboxypeptidase regulatory-like domain-containing protein [Acidobacteriota bacterium]
MNSRRFLTWAIAAAAGLGAAFAVSGTLAAQQRGELAGMGRLSGTVTSPQPFKAAQVFITNVDKNIVYMVFTSAGQFRSVALFPGDYEVSVKTKGLESDVQKVAVRAGDNAKLNLSLHPGQGVVPPAPRNVTFARYAEIYPREPGVEVIESGCMRCHDENFLPSRPGSEDIWRARLGHMMGAELDSRDARSYAEGALAGRVQWFPFAKKDRENFIAYVAKNFGPDAKPRFVRAEQDVPMDEALLGKAIFIEYRLPIDPPGTGSSSPEFAKRGRGIRWGQDVRFDADGNVWLTDRGYPHRLVKLNPRTGEQKNYLYPDGAKLGNHDLIIDRQGIVWAPEHSGFEPSGNKRILGFNPRTEKWDYQVPGDPDNVIRNEQKWMQSMALDSKGNLYVGWIMGGAITKLDRATMKTKVYPMTDRGAVPYGVVSDKNDNIWIALWNSGKLAKFDTINEQWTEFAPLTFPAHIRRLNVDAQNNVWAAIWNQGRRAGRLAKLDQTTGRFTEYPVPLWTSQPYDVNADAEGNIWFADSPTPDRAAIIGKFNPRNQAWSFYPKIQFDADTPKIQVTKDGAIWFSPRGSRDKPALGVLYPDMDKITTLGAFYQYGPPGYPWPTPTTQTASRTASR